jgi:membrane-associated phospholipid phosphatase
MRSSILAVSVAVALVTTAPSVRAAAQATEAAPSRTGAGEPAASAPEPPGDDETSLRWDDARHSRADWPHVVVAGALLAAGLVGYFALRPETPRWTERNELDDAIREPLVLGSFEERETVADLTDALFISMLGFPILIDSILAAGVIRGSSDVALQTGLISAEVLSLGLVAEVVSWQAARERPFLRECAEDPNYAAGCDDVGGPSPTSFAGGHALMSFVSAGVTCAHHTNLPIYGHPGADAAACISALALATGVAVGRLPADRHYFTDTLAGAGLGLLIGWLAPVLVHYHPWSSGAPSSSVVVLPGAPGAQGGLSIAGSL